MVIQSLEKTYEVLRQLESDIFVSHYLCKESDGEEVLRVVAEIKAGEVTMPLICEVTEYDDIPAFTDFQETFSYNGNVYAVFSYQDGVLLKEGLEGGAYTAPFKYELVRQVLERLIVQSIPERMAEFLLAAGRIVVTGENDGFGFLYGLQYWDGKSEGNTVFGLMKDLFSAEADSGLYPELIDFYKLESIEPYEELMELYKKYLLLMPAFTDERTFPVKEKVTFPERLKQRSGSIGKGIKMLFGVLAMVMACVTLVLLWKEKLFPVIESAYLVKTVNAGENVPEGYHGRVLIQDAQTGRVIKKGMMEEGLLSGYGVEYHQSGQPLYEGEFTGGEYGGNGTLYDSQGNVLYKGEFAEGLYHGSGTLYGSRGTAVYQGSFVRGRKEGEGSLYDQEENLIYEGGFKADRYEGKGSRLKEGQIVEAGEYEGGLLVSGNGFFYDEQGLVCYEGSIEDGVKQGEGIAYEKGKMVYEGSFLRNRYEGSGRLYSGQTGDLLYEGEFKQGLYSGEGTLYEPGTEYIRYFGGFRKGFYDGEGLEYDASGNLMYEGNFRLGVYNGEGVFYDTYTGIPILEGIFRNGMLVTSVEVLKALEESRKQTEPKAESEAFAEETQEENQEDSMASEGQPAEGTEQSEDSTASSEEEEPKERGPGYERKESSMVAEEKG